jgi:chemotaxis signal transduction protein
MERRIFLLYIHFSIQEAKYLLESRYVKEIIPCIKITPLSELSTPFLGVANYRGDSIKIVDFQLLTTGKPLDPKMHARIIVAQTPQKEQTLGILVDSVDAIIEGKSVQEKVVAAFENPEHPFIKEFVVIEGESRRILDGEVFFQAFASMGVR